MISQIIKTIGYLLFFLCLFGLVQSCGTSTHEIDASSVPKQIDIVHRIDIEDFKEQFINQCEEEFDTQPEIDLCVQEKINELLEFFNGIGGEDDNE